MDGFKVCQIVVVDVHTNTEVKTCVSPINYFEVSKLKDKNRWVEIQKNKKTKTGTFDSFTVNYSKLSTSDLIY